MRFMTELFCVTGGSRMLWLLLCLLPVASCSSTDAQDAVYLEKPDHESVAVTTRPHIFNCRSKNMEDFACWWRPLDNLTETEEVTYVLTYSIEQGPSHECPDYTSAGPNSCHFDKSHTNVWKIYCINVTAVTAHRNYTSQQRCLDIADIVQTEAPVNLTYQLEDTGGHEVGHTAHLSWEYPEPSDLQYGWITLLYELQYRSVDESEDWKVKFPLNEPHVKLLGLPVGDYEIRVRCRSKNYGLWSKFSSPLFMSIPSKTTTGKLVVMILVTSVSVVSLLVIGFGVVPQSRRIKDFFLPPIPKPRIMGIDPLLLEKGHLDEINRHFSTFHSYCPPSYTEDVWDQVSTDSLCFSVSKDSSVPAANTDQDKDPLMVPCDIKPVAARVQVLAQNPSSYVQSPSPYCSSPPDAFTPPLPVSSLWPNPELPPLPDYNVIGHDNSLTPPDSTAVTAGHSPPDFYTCVQLVNESSQLHLVPYISTPYCSEFPPPLGVDVSAGEKEEKKKKKLAEYQARKNVTNEQK
ncbi:prolactin receptor-like isoform X1 [Solea solea]|uniref:prolactin receptor-like isoform X1 n=2 Tax=Solea solea TaxID=90069 RepID=UPI00272B031A|nr:prolactin receptor-like isoform X1 [Solea solea]